MGLLHQPRQPFGFCTQNFLPKIGQPIVTAPLIIERGVEALVLLGKYALFQQALDGAVKGTGA